MSTAIELQPRDPAILPRAPLLHLLGVAVGGAALQLTPAAAAAQKLKFDLLLESKLAASSNAARVPGGSSDLILDLNPSIRMKGQGGRLKLDLAVGFISRSYLQGTQENRADPMVDARASVEVVDGWLTVDTTASATTASSDPFAARTESPNDASPNTYRQYRTGIAPRLKRDLSPEWTLQGRADHSWLRSSDPNTLIGARETTHNEDSALRIDRRALPVGLSAEVRRQRQTNPAAVRNGTVLSIDAARVGTSYRFTPTLLAGITAGREHSTYLTRDDKDDIAGVNLEWSPNERSWLRGQVEQRFFGPAFDLAFNHRSPFLVVNGSWSRQPGIAGSTLGTGQAGSSMAGLLDGLLTTRIPNPIDRATAVNRLITERGLPATLSQATEVVDQTPQLVQNAAVSLVVLGVRHTIAASLYGRSARELRREGELSLGLSASDFRQRGASVVVSRRLAPTMTLSVALERSLTDGLAGQAGDYTRETKAKAELNLALAPRTQMSVGIGRDIVRSNRAGNFEETRAHVGLLQNF